MPPICIYCNEDITLQDRLARFQPPTHYECGIRMFAGSVAHILHQCGCYVPGSTETDPPGLTLRQAATEAMHAFLMVEACKKGAAHN